MKKVKIALVYDAIYPFVKGGGEKRFYEMGKQLAATGHEVHWYGMKFWEGSNTKELGGIILHGICKARPLYTKSGRRSITQALIFGLSTLKLLFADYDVIDCCGFPYFSLFPAKLSAFLKRKPLYATWHEVWGRKYWQEYLGTLGILGYLVELLATKLPDMIIANSQHTAVQLSKSFGVTNTVVVPNGINLKLIESIAPARGTSDLIYVGRIVDFKNLHLIIEALARLKEQGKMLTFSIVGDGPAKKELQKLAKELNVNEQIYWHGFIEKSEDVYSYIKASRFFVLPSQREGFGIVAVEANACGKPVLTGNFPANAAKDFISPGKNGHIFDPSLNDLDSLLQKVYEQATRLEASCRKVAKDYDWSTLAREQAKVYCR